MRTARIAFRLVHLANIMTVTSALPRPRCGSTAHGYGTERVRRRRCGHGTLAETLRDDLGLTGTKIACGEGHCGACTVQLDGVPVLSCITLVHTVGEREVTTIEGLRDHPLVAAFVRADALQCGFCTPGQIVSAAALVADTAEPSARRSDTAWPATSAAAARIRGSRRRSPRGKADQVREGGRGPLRGGLDARRGGRARPVAGRAGRGGRKGRAAARRLQKARGEARYTGDIQLPGMLHSAILRSPHARARVRRIDLGAAAAAPGVLAVIGPGEVVGIDEEAHFEGGAVAGVAAETLAQARAALELIEVEWEELEPLLDADEAVARGSLLQESRRYERGDYEQGLAQADAVVEAEYTTQIAEPQPARDAPVRLRVARRRPRRLRLDAVHLGAPQRAGRASRSAAGQGARDLRVHGRRLRRQERDGQLPRARGRAGEENRSGRFAAPSPAGRRTSSAATATPRASG